MKFKILIFIFYILIESYLTGHKTKLVYFKFINKYYYVNYL